MNTEKKEYKYSVLGKVRTLQLTVKKDTISLRKQKLGIVPNLIHSMDASNISLLVNNLERIEENIPILTIHDCFATNANFSGLLDFQVKSAFLFIYKDQKFIENYHTEIISYLKNLSLKFDEDSKILYHNNKQFNVPKVPDLDKTLDLNKNVLYSKYFLK